MEKYKIGFVDENQEQVDIFERRLRKDFDIIGYDIKEGTSLDDLLNQVYDSEIDLLMVDFLMRDSGLVAFNGDEVIRRYEEIKPLFPMIIFTNEERQAFPKVDNPNIIYEKNMVTENREKFVEILRKNIVAYSTYIQKRKDAIAWLMEKAEKEVLNGKEKHLLTEAQFELLNLDKKANEVPVQLLKDNKVDNLIEITKEAEAFLASLKKESKDAPPKK